MTGQLFLIRLDIDGATVDHVISGNCRGYRAGQVPRHVWNYAYATALASSAAAFSVGYYYPAQVTREPRNHCATFVELATCDYLLGVSA